MARSGILAQLKPASNTLSVLYSAPSDSSASAVLTVANDGTGSAYDVGVKDFDQKVTLDANTYKLHKGDIITSHRFTLGSAIAATSSLVGGSLITSDDGEKTAKFDSYYVPAYTDIHVKDILMKRLTVESVTGTFAAGETLTKGTGGNTTTALIYDAYLENQVNYILIGPETLNGSGSAFAASDSVSNGSGASATISSGGVGTAAQDFVFSITTAGGVYSAYTIGSISLFTDRAYRFNVGDTSMSGRDFKISTTVNGEWGPDGTAGNSDDGTEYTTGKTTSGTAGSGGTAYVQYDLSANSSPAQAYYYYDGGTGTAANSGYGGANQNIATSGAFTYTEIYVYDLVGTWANGSDSFTVDATSFTVSAQTSGKWGYIRSFAGTTCKIVLGLNSSAWAGSDTFLDLPKLGSATRATATISSVDTDVAALDAENYITVGVSNGNNEIDKITSIVLAPGERMLVKTTTNNNAFTLMGFEDTSTEFTLRNYESQ